MENSNRFGVIMAGGIGSRFWPMSTPEKPKQFLDVLGIGKTLLQLTFDRLSLTCPVEQIYVLTNANYASLVAEQLPQIELQQILCEPMRKNTAPCIAYAAEKIYALRPDACMVVAPSDHLILQEDAFQANLKTAFQRAATGQIVTLGIPPSRPDTGYGYIEVSELSSEAAFEAVKQFREKPNIATAKEFLAAGCFYWNSGIFIWKASTVLQALADFQPELYRLFHEVGSAYNTPREQSAIDEAFRACADISIDYAVMEKAKNVEMVKATFDWSDLGTWGSLYTHLDTDDSGNAIVGKKVEMVDSTNCLVHVPEESKVLLQGLNNAIVVQAGSTFMVIQRSEEQNIKEYMKRFQE